MQQITNTHAAKVKSPVLSLAISWLIILGTYFNKDNKYLDISIGNCFAKHYRENRPVSYGSISLWRRSCEC